MTALSDALTRAGHTPTPADLFPRPRPVDPQLSNTHWNHRCPHPGCAVWVPNHRRGCARHEETA